MTSARATATTTPTQREEARALVAQALSWGNRAELPTAEDATATWASLNSYGEHFRDAVRARMPAAVPHLLMEADGRLGRPLAPALPNHPLTRKTVVHRAQNLARLVQALLTALGDAPPTTDEHTTEGNTDK
ncbi:hypothetical protein ACIG53_13590 [Streptomyces bauhiniae]|uniref:hypothetical protein n=1 Tax=Streptomyces bauhiniae TaxID=2340725 RepID=UPI0037D8FBB6